MTLTRRDFLRAGAVGMSAFFLPRGPTRDLVRAAHAATSPVLVALYLRGGADALTLVVPTFDPDYYTLRPTLAVPPGSELPLADGFGFHPSLADLMPFWNDGRLAVVHACGSPDPSRSHFDCQDFMERAAPGDKSVATGWLNRYLGVAGGGAPIAGITLKRAKAKSMTGAAPSVAFASIADFAMTGAFVPERREAVEARYAFETDPILGQGMRDAFEVLDVVGAVDTTTAVTYPVGELGPVLQDAAALIKAEVGVRVIAVDLGGWDHHSNQDVLISALAAELSAALAAFYADLGAWSASTLTLAMTEFGRRPSQNGGGGSDHGHGGVMLALGDGIAGGRVLLRDDVWPGLAPGDLYNGEDLQVTTDFRDIFAEALNRHLLVNVGDMGPVFPGFTVDAGRFPGLWV